MGQLLRREDMGLGRIYGTERSERAALDPVEGRSRDGGHCSVDHDALSVTVTSVGEIRAWAGLLKQTLHGFHKRTVTRARATQDCCRRDRSQGAEKKTDSGHRYAGRSEADQPVREPAAGMLTHYLLASSRKRHGCDDGYSHYAVDDRSHDQALDRVQPDEAESKADDHAVGDDEMEIAPD